MLEQVIQNNPELLIIIAMCILYYGSFLDDSI